jgi:hypothetical protein
VYNCKQVTKGGVTALKKASSKLEVHR